MVSYKKGICFAVLACLLLGMLGGCAEQEAVSDPPEEISSVVGVDEKDQFSDRDNDADYDSGAAEIVLKENATAAVNGVQVSGNTITVQKAGTYRLRGSLTDGRIIVDAAEDAKIQLVLEGVSVTCSGFGALYVRRADKVFLTLKEGTDNRLITTAATTDGVEENVDGTLYSKDDLTVNGGGKLTVTGPGHGLVIKADLVVADGVLDVTAEGHGIQAKKSARFASGEVTLNTLKDGVHVENPDNTEEGYLYIAGGEFTITAAGDGFSAATLLQVAGGSGSLLCGGGAANGPTHTGGFGGHTVTQTDEEDVSAKGMKGGTGVRIDSGRWNLDTADDGLHSNGDLTVKDGTLTIATGDDGIHADGQAGVLGGEITVTQSYEGIEGNCVEIAGGTLSIVASDDGLNAAGGNDESGFGGGFGGYPDRFSQSDSGSYIRLSGGELLVDASGDGLDSNGDLYIDGGQTYVVGPVSGGNGALDYGGSAKITGGVLCAVGSSGMAQGFTEATTQGGISLSVGTMATGPVVLTDSAGNELFRWTPNKNYNFVALTCPGLVKGETYTLTLATVTETVEMTDWIYGESGGFGGGPGGFGGGPGGGGNKPGR